MGGPTSANIASCRPGAKGSEDPCLVHNPYPTIAPDTVVPLPQGPVKEGYASTYGQDDGFQGRPTATGDLFNTYAHTIAMREASWRGRLVLIERLDPATRQVMRSTVARVNDWGPDTKIHRTVRQPDGTQQIVEVPLVGPDGKTLVADLSKSTYWTLTGDRDYGKGRILVRMRPVQEKVPADRPFCRIYVDGFTDNRHTAFQMEWDFVRRLPNLMPALWRSDAEVPAFTVRTGKVRLGAPDYAIVFETRDPELADGLFASIVAHYNPLAMYHCRPAAQTKREN